MQKIFVYSIAKEQRECFTQINDDFKKQISRFANIYEKKIYNKKIDNAQKSSPNMAKKMYSDAFEKYIDGYTIALDVKGVEMDSFEFSHIFEKEDKISFFIAGAYGFEESFIKKTNKVISLSRLTFAHKIALSVLLEQIYRALTIKNNHPYHK